MVVGGTKCLLVAVCLLVTTKCLLSHWLVEAYIGYWLELACFLSPISAKTEEVIIDY